MLNRTYVLITTARNEEDYIERTIQAVIKQTIKPLQWIIISDGSTDKTDEIVNRYTKEHTYITLLRRENTEKRNFGAKSRAIAMGYEKLKSLDFRFFGNLDADISFPPNYYETIMEKFDLYPDLGVAGGLVYDLINGKFRKQSTSRDSVSGPIQFFTRECYEAFGGYIPLRLGGVDLAAETMARMKGWKTRYFDDVRVNHYRQTGTFKASIYKARIKLGLHDYVLGYHPLFFLLRCIYRIKDDPFFIGSFLQLIGFLKGLLQREELSLPAEVIDYLRLEQKKKLLHLLRHGKLPS